MLTTHILQIDIDFDYLFQHACMALISGWEKFFATIFDLRKDIIKGGAASELVNCLQEDNLSDNLRVLLYYLTNKN